jgi:hypothetical protein
MQQVIPSVICHRQNVAEFYHLQFDIKDIEREIHSTLVP